MEQIINQIIANFNFPLIIIINVLTYLIVKVLDDIDEDKTPTTWHKRIVFVIVSIMLGIVYNRNTDVPINIIINSCIVAPVNWSWLIKPIANKLGIDYKKNNENNLFN